jgi:hypothetical protein
VLSPPGAPSVWEFVIRCGEWGDRGIWRGEGGVKREEARLTDPEFWARNYYRRVGAPWSQLSDHSSWGIASKGVRVPSTSSQQMPPALARLKAHHPWPRIA